MAQAPRHVPLKEQVVPMPASVEGGIAGEVYRCSALQGLICRAVVSCLLRQGRRTGSKYPLDNNRCDDYIEMRYGGTTSD
jgi:hypothetical protein